MTNADLQKIRAIVYDAYCEGDTEAEWMLVVIDAAIAAEQEPVATDCTRIMREQGKPYPRTCPRCGFGPCVYSSTIAIPAPVAAPQQPVSMETVYDTIIEWSTAGKGSRRELARRMIALFATQQREWQGIADTDFPSIRYGDRSYWAGAKWAENLLRTKNEGKNT